MTDEGVKNTITKLLIDDDFKKNFFENPKKAIEHTGFSVNENELTALSKIKPDDVNMKITRDTNNRISEITVTVSRID